MKGKSKKFLIVHLVANGDCLMVTTIAKQIKTDNPDCHLTWAISYKCKQVIINNPHVDTIWEVQHDPKEDFSKRDGFWAQIKNEAETRKQNGEFDEIIYSQLQPQNIHHFDGTTRSSTFRAYPKKITVDVSPVMNLLPSEVSKVKDFAEKNNLKDYKRVVLCECTPSSGQSFMNLQTMLTIAGRIVKNNSDIIFIISTHIKLDSSFGERIIDASVLSFRENAELSKYCTLFVGCSSGITWLLSSDWAKKLNTVQFLQYPKFSFSFASVAYDFSYWGLSTQHILETGENDLGKMEIIITKAIEDFDSTKKKYSKTFKPQLIHLAMVIKFLLSKYPISGWGKSFFSFNNYIQRNNLKKSVIFKVLYLIIVLIFQKKERQTA